jgi:hypothetical protein
MKWEVHGEATVRDTPISICVRVSETTEFLSRDILRARVGGLKFVFHCNMTAKSWFHCNWAQNLTYFHPYYSQIKVSDNDSDVLFT